MAESKNNIYIDKENTRLERMAKESFGEMRDATKEELESVDRYIKSISKPTGIDFFSHRERILNTFAAHKEHKIEYGSKSDTIMRFAQRTKYNIDVVRKERKIRQIYDR